ncbi:MAG TPA: translation initiation factor [Bacteroidales bacterium]|nr:translation initiation factor [Bacteroidales bacterium]
MPKNKKKTGIVGNIMYSTNPNFHFEYQKEEETPAAKEQDLKIWLDKKHRGGKQATVIKGFVGNEEDLKDLAKILKTKCGVGGSAKDAEIIIQGDLRDKVLEILKSLGYKAKKAGA